MKKLMAVVLALLPLCAYAQQAVELKQKKLSKWDIGTANYSGITSIGGNRYAVVSDKEPTDGFFIFRIDQNTTTGKVEDVYLEGFYGNPSPVTDNQGNTVRDCEGIAYFAPHNTLLISGEGDQAIKEYLMDGSLSGRELQVPPMFSLDKIVPNMGFEALSYSPETQQIWTVTESTLPQDGYAAGPAHPTAQNLLRLQSFGMLFNPTAQFAYRMEKGKSDDFGAIYVYGVPAITALPDGKLLVLEREADISHGYMSSEVSCKVFLVDPTTSWQIDGSIDLKTLDPNRFMIKQLVASFKTKYTPFVHKFANYEGMCLGQKLADGRQTVLLISDSQANYGKGVFRLNDYIKVLILP